MMREAVSKLSGVLAKKDIIPLLTCLINLDGMLYAGNGHLVAAAPTGFKENFCVRGAMFQQFLNKTPGEIKVVVQENHAVKVSSGRFRATIPGFNPEALTYSLPTSKPTRIKSTLIEKLKAVRPFISDNATQPWAACANVRGGYAQATNNVTIVKADGTGLPKSVDFMLPYDAVDFLLQYEEGLESVAWDDNCIVFYWKDKSWLRIPQTSYSFPNTEAILTTIPDPTWEVTEEWREAYDHVAGMIEGEVQFHPDRIVGHNGDTLIEATVKTPVPGERTHTNWNSRFMGDVIKQASHVLFYEAPYPRASFKNEQIIGITNGMGK
jgi:hypothetical protein